MATIRKRGDLQWQAQVRRKGHPNLTKTFNTKADAESWARDIESKLDKGIFLDYTSAQQTTFAMAIKRYKTEVTPNKKGWSAELSKLKNLIITWANILCPYLAAKLLLISEIQD